MSSGVRDLDELLGGLIAGDNVVWSYDDAEVIARFEDAFIAEGLRAGAACYVVTTDDAPSRVIKRFAPEVIVLDARPGRRFADPMDLEQTVIEAARGSIGRFAIEGSTPSPDVLDRSGHSGFSVVSVHSSSTLVRSRTGGRRPTRSRLPSSIRSARSRNASSRSMVAICGS